MAVFVHLLIFTKIEKIRFLQKRKDSKISQMIINKKRFWQMKMGKKRFLQMIMNQKRFLQMIIRKIFLQMITDKDSHRQEEILTDKNKCSQMRISKTQ